MTNTKYNTSSLSYESVYDKILMNVTNIAENNNIVICNISHSGWHQSLRNFRTELPY